MDLGSPESNALPLSSLDDGVEPRVTELRLYDTDRHVGELCNRNKALKTAIEAAEHCMRDLRAAINEEERIRLDKKCRELLREAERLKLSTRRDSHGDEVKRTLSGRDSSSKINSKLKEPLSSRQLSTREQIIILEGSKLNGFIFPPWKCPPDPDEFELKDGGSPFLYVEQD